MLGARGHYIVPEIMDELGALTCFVTDTFIGQGSWLQTMVGQVGRRLGIRGLRSLAGRGSRRIPRERVAAFQWLGLCYRALQSRFVRAGDVRLFATVNRRFCRKAVRYLGGIDVCWGYNGAALELFGAARARNICCVLEQVIAPREVERRELEQAAMHWPAWSSAKELLQPIAADPLAQREQAEWRLANMIVAGSSYVQDCLQQSGVPSSRCAVVLYGVDLARFTVGTDVENVRPLRVLFVGQVNLRKGVPYLLDAVRRLNSRHIELKVIGPLQIAREQVSVFSLWASFTGQIPLSDIASEYRWADILIVPSICEGSAISHL